jgi:hypothetical protein
MLESLSLHLQSDRHDDGSSKHLWNVGQFLPGRIDCTAQLPRRQCSINSQPWEPEMSYTIIRRCIIWDRTASINKSQTNKVKTWCFGTITNSMKKTSSCEDYTRSASQEIPRLFLRFTNVDRGLLDCDAVCSCRWLPVFLSRASYRVKWLWSWRQYVLPKRW